MLSGMSKYETESPPERGVFANRTLNLRAVQAIGYDMDYTLIHYRAEEWERAAFEHARAVLARRGWPVDPLVLLHCGDAWGACVSGRAPPRCRADRSSCDSPSIPHVEATHEADDSRIAHARWQARAGESEELPVKAGHCSSACSSDAREAPGRLYAR